MTEDFRQGVPIHRRHGGRRWV